MRTAIALALGTSILIITLLAALFVPTADSGHGHDWRDQQPVDLSLVEAVLDAAADAANAFLGS